MNNQGSCENLARNLASNHAKTGAKLKKPIIAHLSLMFISIRLVVPETAFLADYF
jgi:hypothetical protein